jgi:hypothetical protein
MLGAVEGEMLTAIIERRKLPLNAAFGGEAVSTGEDGEFPTKCLDGGMKLTLLLPTMTALRNLRVEWERTVKEHGLEPGSADDALDLWRKKEKLPDDALGDEESPKPKVLEGRPLREDDSKPNASSIAFVAEYDKKRCLFTGDAHPGDLEARVRALADKEGTARLQVDMTKLSHHGSAGSTSNELLDALDCPRYLVSSSGASYGHPKLEAISRVVIHGGRGAELRFNYETKFNGAWKDRHLQDEFGYTAVYPEDAPGGLSSDV